MICRRQSPYRLVILLPLHLLILVGLAAAIIGTSPVLRAESWTVKNKVVEVDTSVRVRAQTKSSVQVINEMYWPPFKWVIPEGSIVKKGDKIVVFRDDFVKSNLDDRQFKLTRNSLYLKQNQLAFDRRLQDFVNNVEALEAKRDVLLSRRTRLQSLPRKEDVEIARGDFSVAQSEYETANEQYEKSKNRLAKGYISPAALDKNKKAADLSRIKRDYIEMSLRIAQLTVLPQSMEIVDLDIANIELEIVYKKQDLEQQKKITEIKHKAASKRLAREQKKYDEKAEELNHIILRAPEDGIVVYTSQLKKKLAEGMKPEKGMTVVDVADLSTVVFSGYLPHALANFYTVGDKVEVQFNAEGLSKSTGKLTAIEKSPLDLAEVSDEWGRGKTTGIKVVTIEITMDEKNSLFKPGVFAQAKIYASKTHTGPAVPLHFIRYKKGDSWISIDGQYQKVSGVVIGTDFFISDMEKISAKSWLSKRVDLDGEFPLDRDRGQDGTGSVQEEFDEGVLALSGELVPIDALPIKVPRQRHYYRYVVSKVIEDGTVVKAGDVVVELSEKNIDKHVENLEEKLSSTKENLESQRKSLKLKKRERDYVIAVAQNNKKTAKLRLEIAQLGNKGSAIRRATMSLAQASIQLADSTAKLTRAEERPERLSPRALSNFKRDLLRQKLQAEKASLELKDLRRIDKVSISAAELTYLRAKVDYENKLVEYDDNVSSQAKTVNWREREYNRHKNNLEKRKHQREQLVVRSPVAGIFRKNKIWDSIQMSKLKQGHRVWRGITLGRVVDDSEMYVRILVPERFFQSIKVGASLQVKIPSINDEFFKGKITQIEPFFIERPAPASQGGGFYGTKGAIGEAVFPVNLKIETDVTLNPGAMAKILLPTGGTR